MMFYRMSSYWNFYLPFSGFLNWKQPNPLKAVSYSNKHTYRHTLWTEYLKKGNERRKEKYLKSYFHKGSVVFNTCWPIQARLGMTGQAFACCLGTPSQCVLWKASLFPEPLLRAHRKPVWCPLPVMGYMWNHTQFFCSVWKPSIVVSLWG